MDNAVTVANWTKKLTLEQTYEVIRLRTASRVTPERCLEALQRSEWNHRIAYEELVASGHLMEMST